MSIKTISNLNKLITAVKNELKIKLYSKHSIAAFNTVWNQLRVFMKENKKDDYSAKVGLDFLEKKFKITIFKKLSPDNRRRARAINLLSDYMLHGIVFSRAKNEPKAFCEQFQEDFEGYIEYKKLEGCASDTLQCYRIYLLRFSEYLNIQKLSNIKEISDTHIINFTNTFTRYSPSVTHNTLCSLRTFFHYLFQKGIVKKNYAYIVPHDSYRKTTKIPSAYSREEVQKLLSTIDRGNPKGKRDYSIILIAARLGIRAQDICDLTFSNLNWDKSQIEIVQHKTKKKNILPLLEDIGMAIIDYLKHGRPDVDSDFIFLRLAPPVGKLEAPTLHSIVSKHLNNAGIKVDSGKKHGPHALRHSLASALLEDNISLPIISEILGHRNSELTSEYLKIDINQLRKCSLDSPPFEWNKIEGEF